MDASLGYCGLQCSTCPILIATREQDTSKQRALRVSVAEMLTKHYGIDFLPENVADCDGCKADTGRLFGGCDQCEIRTCAFQRQLESCAFCVDYTCELLRKHYAHDPESQDRLDELRGNRAK
jgi:hypothetical protein